MRFLIFRKGRGVPEITALALISALLFLVFPCGFCSKKTQIARRAACVNNLKVLGLALTDHARENDGLYPPIDSTKNNFILEGEALYPKYLQDASYLACPGDPHYDPKKNFRLISGEHHPDHDIGQTHPDCITDKSYVYLGWMVMSDKEAEAFFEAYDNMSLEDYDNDVAVPEGWGNSEGDVLHRLSWGVDRFLITEITYIGSGPSDARLVPIMWDRPYTDPSRFRHHHYETGEPAGNVLYLDGHVEYVAMGEKFPMTETMARLLEERPREPIPDCEE